MSAELAQETTQKFFHLHPELEEKYGAMGREKCRQDAQYHLSYLIEAVGAGSMTLFSDYVLWTQEVLETRKVPVKDLHEHLIILKDVIALHLPIDQYVRVANHLNNALQLLEEKNGLEPQPEEPLEPLAQTYLELLLAGKRKEANDMILQEVAQGMEVKELYLTVFQPVQHRVGRLWQTNKITVAQEHFCTAITQSIMSQLYPYIFGSERNGYKLLASCVAGDLHELGLRMVSDFFEMEGWDTYYLGANVPTASILSSLREHQPDLLLLSATMTFHVQALKDIIRAVRAAEDLQEIKIMVGGYPFNLEEELWREVGADGYGANAKEAMELALGLVSVRK
ncbi:methanogenic corrinoid protein MtbC1 [Rufibacter quisquiliarum]|uniref:Methanogenic corrinoid protein MtbC1 n=2 Tax=Hymenobacteraceae TaxID=1853232 RepID=A0A839GSG6_9BACT|nr:methanogenic corrinoid protein MtbC1 [Rufibacter quisquiliarum]